MARFYEILFISALLSLTASALQVLATYEDLSADDYVDVASLGDYDGLYYTAISLVDVGLETTVTGIIPESGVNVVYYGDLNGLATQATPSITVKFEQSIISEFDFESFYFGCLGALATYPVSCTVTVQGILNGLPVNGATQSFTFVPTSPLLSAMTEAVLSPAFAVVDTITFETTYVNSLALTSVTVIDNMGYSPYGPL